MYRDMRRARVVDEKLVSITRSGRSSFFAQAAGQEATQVGAAHALRPGFDWIWSYYRDQGLALALGASLLEWFAEVMGKRSEASKGHQLAHHFGSKPINLVSQGPSIGSQVPPAVGTAYAQQLAGAGDITLCTFGDGATSAGDWHAGLNMAGVLQAPVIFLCENNQYAISVEFAGQSAPRTIAMRAPAHGMPGYYVDGQDVLAVQAVVQEAVDRARAGGGPT
ncbi:thiamine pyrophosphate-dependent dehydrogenase E1 component subunit alpha [Deinococcus sp.]|uniref:thiamine pyrophosphate-dependent dehydrogenase E1 component subunit alpha n=1 Tax=Deinococcus sp. TaxID=47478 RepID=UPI00344B5289